MKSTARYVAAFLAADAVTAAVASIVQTQTILGQLVEFGGPVTASVRAWSTLEDMARFGPVMVGIAVTALLPAVPMGHLVMRAVPPAWGVAVPRSPHSRWLDVRP